MMVLVSFPVGVLSERAFQRLWMHEPVPVGNPVGGLLSSLDWFFVGLDIEVDEEAEVACKQCAAEDGSALGTGTVSIDGQTRVVSGREVRVSCNRKLSMENDKSRRSTHFRNRQRTSQSQIE